MERDRERQTKRLRERETMPVTQELLTARKSRMTHG